MFRLKDLPWETLQTIAIPVITLLMQNKGQKISVPDNASAGTKAVASVANAMIDKRTTEDDRLFTQTVAELEVDQIKRLNHLRPPNITTEEYDTLVLFIAQICGRDCKGIESAKKVLGQLLATNDSNEELIKDLREGRILAADTTAPGMKLAAKAEKFWTQHKDQVIELGKFIGAPLTVAGFSVKKTLQNIDLWAVTPDENGETPLEASQRELQGAKQQLEDFLARRRS